MSVTLMLLLIGAAVGFTAALFIGYLLDRVAFTPRRKPKAVYTMRFSNAKLTFEDKTIPLGEVTFTNDTPHKRKGVDNDSSN